MSIHFFHSAFDNFSCSREEGHLLQQASPFGWGILKVQTKKQTNTMGERSPENFAGQEIQFGSVMLLVLFS